MTDTQRQTRSRIKSAAERAKELREANIKAPIGGIRTTLGFPEMRDPDWHLHWFINNTEDRAKAKHLGYDPVTQEDILAAVKTKSDVEILRDGGKGPDGTQVEMVLMKTPKSYYAWRKEEQANAIGGHRYMKNLIDQALPQQNDRGEITQKLDGNLTIPSALTTIQTIT